MKALRDDHDRRLERNLKLNQNEATALAVN